MFVGEVGRPDIAATKTVSKLDLAAKLYYSLRNIIMNLNDELIVMPCHGQGSACGKKISSKETWSTIGAEKKNNYALQAMDKDEFI